jgi:acyl dehydratase
MRMEAGRRFAPATVRVETETQARCLRAVGLEPASFGGNAAPTLLGNEAYRALRAAGVSIDGWIETDVHFEQAEPAQLDEPLELSFHVAEGAPHPRGWRLRLAFAFARPGAAPLLRFSMGAIQAEPRATPARAQRREEDPRAGLQRDAALQLTPERVLDFSGYVGNEIHLDPAFARRQGFRAPVAQGLMTTALLTGALQAARPYRRLDARVRYLRPVFWDDALELWRDGDWRRLRALAGGRLAAEGEIAEASA